MINHKEKYEEFEKNSKGNVFVYLFMRLIINEINKEDLADEDYSRIYYEALDIVCSYRFDEMISGYVDDALLKLGYSVDDE